MTEVQSIDIERLSIILEYAVGGLLSLIGLVLLVLLLTDHEYKPGARTRSPRGGYKYPKKEDLDDKPE